MKIFNTEISDTEIINSVTNKQDIEFKATSEILKLEEDENLFRDPVNLGLSSYEEIDELVKRYDSNGGLFLNRLQQLVGENGGELTRQKPIDEMWIIRITFPETNSDVLK